MSLSSKLQERTRSVADAAAGGGVQCTGGHVSSFGRLGAEGLNQIDSCVEGPQVHLFKLFKVVF